MTEYHKIQTIFKRDSNTRFKTLLEGDYSLPVFDYLKHNQWIFTEKVDGTNIRIMIKDNNIFFGGKTENAQIPFELVNRLHSIFDPQQNKLIELFPNGACLYGEGYGAKIQSGGNYSPTQEFVLFDVKIGDWWLERYNIENIATKLNLQVVPIVGEGTLLEMVEIARRGIISHWGNFSAEGLVARPKCEFSTRNGERIITKIKTKDFIHLSRSIQLPQ